MPFDSLRPPRYPIRSAAPPSSSPGGPSMARSMQRGRGWPPIGTPQLPEPPYMRPPTDFPGGGNDGTGTGYPGGGTDQPRPPDDPSIFYRPDLTFNPYAENPDFAYRQVTVPGGAMHLAEGQQPPNILDMRQGYLDQIRGGQYGNLPPASRVAAMQQSLDAVRRMGGINYGTPGSGRTQVGGRAEGSPAGLAIQLRRQATAGQRSDKRKIRG